MKYPPLINKETIATIIINSIDREAQHHLLLGFHKQTNHHYSTWDGLKQLYLRTVLQD